MKKHLLSIIASIVICALLLIGCGGGGGGGGGNSNSSEPSEFIYSTVANSKGTFWLSSSKSGAVVESSEVGTLASGTSVVLVERLPKSNESKLFGGNSSNIYTLKAKNSNKTIINLEKPIIVTIPNNFGKEYKRFFLGSRSETANDWQYIEILDDNDVTPNIAYSSRLAVKESKNFRFKIFRLSYSYAIFAIKDGSDLDKKMYSVKVIQFSSNPTNLYFDKSSKYITDIKVSSCITSNKSSALFDGSEVTSQLVFFNSNSADLSGLKIDSVNAVQTSSTTKDSSNNQYSHTLYIKSYKTNNIAISGNNATYTFELKLTGVSTKDFPDSFRVKTVLKDANGTEFASEGSINLIKEKEPEKIDTNTTTNTSTGTNTKTSTGTSTNTKTSTGTNTNTKTSTNTSTSTKTNTSTSTSTKTNTSTSTDTSSSSSTSTSTTTNTDTNTGSSTSTQTNTNTNTSSNTKTSTETNTGGNTNTSTNTNTESNTSTQTQTNTNTSSETSTQTNTQTSTNTDTSSNTSSSTSTETVTTTEISVSISPTNSETTKVEVTTPIKITFNEKMDKTQNLLSLVTLICNSTTTNLITASNQLEWSNENNKDVLIVKNIKLNPEQSYTIKLNSGLKTESGLTSTNQISSNFVTRDAVALSVTNLTTQNAPLNTIIEITPTGGTISSIENASINLNPNSKAGSFSIQNGKAYFTLTSGTTWNPNTTHTGTINGILDSDGCETKTCSFSFTTRNQTTLTFQSQNSYHARSSLAFTVNNGTITDLSTANISYSGGSINCSLNSNNGNIICNLGENAQWAFNSYLSITISNLKDSEGAPVANSTANFNIGAQPYLSCDNSNIKANSDLVFTLNESTITSLANANVSFTGANVTGNLQLVNGKVVYKLANNSLYPFGSNATINISGLKDSNGVTVANLSQDFYTAAQTEIESFAKSENLRDNISLSYSGGFTGWNVSNATAVFDNANVSGTFSIENGKIIYKLNTGYNYPPSTTVTGKISGIKDADGLPVKDYNLEFTTRERAEVYISVFNQCITDKYSRDEEVGFKSSLFESNNISYNNIDFTNARMIMNNNAINGTFSIEDKTLIFTPSTLYPKNTSVTAKLTGLKDYEGVSFTDFEFNFDTYYFAGYGTEEDPYLVSSAEDLSDIRFVNDYKYFEQTQNIDLSDYGDSYDDGKGWLPITTGGELYYCPINYNGKGFKVSNLYINRPNDSAGLFGNIYGCITDLGVEVSLITCANGGAISSKLQKDNSSFCNIRNCWVTGNKIIGSEREIGGLFGYVMADEISSCYSNIDIEVREVNEVSPNSVGGFAGEISANVVKNCYSLGNITHNTWSFGYIGGFVGLINNVNKMTSCFSKCNIEVIGNNSYGDSIGGFLGDIRGANVSNCYCSGQINVNIRSSSVGSFLGKVDDNSLNNIINSYTTSNINVNLNNKNDFDCVGGFIGLIYVANLKNNYSGCSELINNFGVNRLVGGKLSDHEDSYYNISNCYANKNMTLIKNGVSTQPGLQNPLPETVALDGVDGANLPDNPDWKNDIFKDGYESGESFDDVWEIGTSGLPILKNMPGNPVQ